MSFYTVYLKRHSNSIQRTFFSTHALFAWFESTHTHSVSTFVTKCFIVVACYTILYLWRHFHSILITYVISMNLLIMGVTLKDGFGTTWNFSNKLFCCTSTNSYNQKMMLESQNVPLIIETQTPIQNFHCIPTLKSNTHLNFVCIMLAKKYSHFLLYFPFYFPFPDVYSICRAPYLHTRFHAMVKISTLGLYRFYSIYLVMLLLAAIVNIGAVVIWSNPTFLGYLLIVTVARVHT